MRPLPTSVCPRRPETLNGVRPTPTTGLSVKQHTSSFSHTCKGCIRSIPPSLITLWWLRSISVITASRVCRSRCFKLGRLSNGSRAARLPHPPQNSQNKYIHVSDQTEPGGKFCLARFIDDSRGQMISCHHDSQTQHLRTPRTVKRFDDTGIAPPSQSSFKVNYNVVHTRSRSLWSTTATTLNTNPRPNSVSRLVYHLLLELPQGIPLPRQLCRVSDR